MKIENSISGRVLKGLSFTTTSDPFRPALENIYIEPKDHKYVLTATDGWRLLRAIIDIDPPDDEGIKKPIFLHQDIIRQLINSDQVVLFEDHLEVYRKTSSVIILSIRYGNQDHKFPIKSCDEYFVKAKRNKKLKICYNSEYYEGMMHSIRRASLNLDSQNIIVSVPDDPSKPAIFESTDKKVVGILMPVHFKDQGRQL